MKRERIETNDKERSVVSRLSTDRGIEDRGSRDAERERTRELTGHGVGRTRAATARRRENTGFMRAGDKGHNWVERTRDREHKGAPDIGAVTGIVERSRDMVTALEKE